MKLILPLLGLLSLAYTSVASAASDITLSAQQIQSLGIVSVALPERSSGTVSGLPAQVVVPSNHQFVMSTPLPGLVEQTMVGVGDSVRKGQVMATLQSPLFAEAQRAYLQASVQEQLAKDNAKRDEALFKDGIISESRLRASKGAALEARAALMGSKQVLRAAGMNDKALSRLQSGEELSATLILTSPMDGVVLEKTVSAGQRLDVAVAVFKVAQLDPLGLEIQAPVSLTRDLRVGAVIEIPAFHARGKLTAIGRGLTGGNQSVLLRGIIDQGAESLRPNQFVEVSIATAGSDTPQWDVPNSALSRVEGKTLVFVATPQGFHGLAVQVLHEGAQNSVITAAFNGREMIAVRGVSALKASMMGIGGDQ